MAGAKETIRQTLDMRTGLYLLFTLIGLLVVYTAATKGTERRLTLMEADIKANNEDLSQLELEGSRPVAIALSKLEGSVKNLADKQEGLATKIDSIDTYVRNLKK